MSVGIYSGVYLTSLILSALCSWAGLACQIIGTWFVFKKLGMPGWKCIIPFYNFYLLFDKVWDKKRFKKYVILCAVEITLVYLYVIVLIVSIMLGVIGANGSLAGSQTALLTAFIISSVIIMTAFVVIMVFLVVIQFKLYNRLAASFGKSTGFAVGLLLLAPIFFMILGLDKSYFLGKGNGRIKQ